MENDLKKAIQHSCLQSDLGKKFSFPLYTLCLTRSSEKAPESDPLKSYRISASPSRQTNMHILENFYKSVI